MLKARYASNLIGGKSSSNTAAPDNWQQLLPRQDQYHQESEDLRLNVYREFLWTPWIPKSPRYWDARPEYFPPQVTVFHTGLLYAQALQATVSARVGSYRGAVSLVCFLVVLFSLVVVLLNTSEEFSYPYLLGSLVFLLAFYCSQAVAGYVCRSELNRLHEQMEALARQLAPAFRAAGYDLEYKSSPARWHGAFCESYFRIVPRSADAVAALTADERDRAESIMKPFAAADCTPGPLGSNERAFRVAVYGPNVGSENVINFLSYQSIILVKPRIDMATWGAVATEMRPLTEKYRNARIWTVENPLLMTFAVFLLLPDAWLEKPWATILGFSLLLVALNQRCFPAPVETWWFEYVLRRSVLDQIRAKVEQLSPLVEERSGYAMRFETRPEGCLGGVGGYVHFELHHDPPTGADCEQASATMSSRRSEPMLVGGTLL
jgi:hypothetical protein